MGSDNKPRTAEGYDDLVTHACERALLTLLGAFGTLGDNLRLIGGLVPRYLTPEAPPDVPPHVGTTDVDIVLDLAVMSTGENYDALAKQLEDRGFRRHSNDGKPSSWQWRLDVGSVPVLVEFLSDGGTTPKPKQVPLAGEDISTLAIPHAGIVCDWYITREVTGQPLEGGILTRKVHIADTTAFIILKALALNKRYAAKDAADLIHVLQYAGNVDEIANSFVEKKLSEWHDAAIEDGIQALRYSFVHPNRNSDSYKCDGPVKYASFHHADADEQTRVEAQRYAAALVKQFLDTYESQLKATRKASRRA